MCETWYFSLSSTSTGGGLYTQCPTMGTVTRGSNTDTGSTWWIPVHSGSCNFKESGDIPRTTLKVPNYLQANLRVGGAVRMCRASNHTYLTSSIVGPGIRLRFAGYCCTTWLHFISTHWSWWICWIIGWTWSVSSSRRPISFKSSPVKKSWKLFHELGTTGCTLSIHIFCYSQPVQLMVTA